MPLVRILVHHGPRESVVLPNGQQSRRAAPSARFDFDAADVAAAVSSLDAVWLRHPTFEQCRQLASESAAAQDVTAEPGSASEEVVRQLLLCGRLRGARCMACAADLSPGDLRERPYRTAHGSWGVNAGIEFDCPHGHRLFDLVTEQTA